MLQRSSVSMLGEVLFICDSLKAGDSLRISVEMQRAFCIPLWLSIACCKATDTKYSSHSRQCATTFNKYICVAIII